MNRKNKADNESITFKNPATLAIIAGCFVSIVGLSGCGGGSSNDNDGNNERSED